MSRIQKFAGVQGDLFDTILVFENYPVSEVISSRRWGLRVEGVEMVEQTNYPLTITISSSDEIKIGFSYNTTLLNEEYVKEIRDHFEHVLMQVISGQESLGEVKLLTKAEEEQLLVEFNDTKADISERQNDSGFV